MRKQWRSEDVIRDGNPGPCPECPRYKTCTKLCSKVESWVNQDHVGKPGRELLELGDYVRINRGTSVGSFIKNRNPFVDWMPLKNGKAPVKPDPDYAETAWEAIKTLNLPKISFDFARLYYREGKRLTEVAKIYKISAQAAHERHKKLKRDVAERLHRMDIWDQIKGDYDIDGYNDDERMTKTDAVIVMYFGLFMSRKEIMQRMTVNDVTVSRAINSIKKKFA